MAEIPRSFALGSAQVALAALPNAEPASSSNAGRSDMFSMPLQTFVVNLALQGATEEEKDQIALLLARRTSASLGRQRRSTPQQKGEDYALFEPLSAGSCVFDTREQQQDNSGQQGRQDGSLNTAEFLRAEARLAEDAARQRSVLPRLAMMLARLQQLEHKCQQAETCGAGQAYFAELLDASFRESLVMTVDAVRSGEDAVPLFDALLSRMGLLYRRHCDGLDTSVAFMASELVQAFEAETPGAHGNADMTATYCCLPLLYLAARKAESNRGLHHA